MNKKSLVPNAWDDDWESQADEISRTEKEVNLSKAERLTRHIEANKKIWQSAEEPEEFLFLSAHDNIPLKSEFKPALKVLSRKPAPTMVQQIDPTTGTIKLNHDDAGDNGEQGDQVSPEELRFKALKELQEKQKRYNAARARILGVQTRSSLPKDTTAHVNSISEGSRSSQTSEKGRRNGRDTRYNDPGLFDPNSTPSRADTIARKKDTQNLRASPREDTGIIRVPRGPDGTGKAGFEFIKKGTR